jgi:hypothetical protein
LAVTGGLAVVTESAGFAFVVMSTPVAERVLEELPGHHRTTF